MISHGFKILRVPSLTNAQEKFKGILTLDFTYYLILFQKIVKILFSQLIFVWYKCLVVIQACKLLLT